MQQEVIQSDSVSNRVRIFIQDSTTFQGKTALAFDTAGLIFSYSNGAGDTAHDISLVTQTVGGSWTSGGFVKIDDTKQPGWYQLDIPNAAFVAVTGSKAYITWKGTGILNGAIEVALTSFNPNALDKTDVSLSTAGILALWNQLTASLVTAGTIGKLLTDNIAGTKTNVDAIKTKTDLLSVDSSGRTKIQPHGLDDVIGYHPAGDA